MLTLEDLFEISVSVSFTRAYWDDVSRNDPDEARRSLGRVKVIILEQVEKRIQAAMLSFVNKPTA